MCTPNLMRTIDSVPSYKGLYGGGGGDAAHRYRYCSSLLRRYGDCGVVQRWNWVTFCDPATQ